MVYMMIISFIVAGVFALIAFWQWILKDNALEEVRDEQYYREHNYNQYKLEHEYANAILEDLNNLVEAINEQPESHRRAIVNTLISQHEHKERTKIELRYGIKEEEK